MAEAKFKIDAFVRFFERHLKDLPMDYISAEQSKMTILFLCLNGLDLISDISEVIPDETRKSYIEWIYSQQIVPNSSDDNGPIYGFRSGSAFTTSSNEKSKNHHTNKYDVAHITMTYSALCCLLILRDDLSRVNKEAIISSIKALSCENGCIYSDALKSELDVRFVYSACAVSYILDDWSGIDIQNAISFINRCKSYEGGYSLNPGCEAHGGSTYCAVSALCLLAEKIPDSHSEDTFRWLANRHISGFQGRPNKEPDMCYAYWIGSSLKMLRPQFRVDVDKLAEYAVEAYHCFGGFGKHIGTLPDVLHTALGLEGLSVTNAANFKSTMDPRIGLTSSTMDYLHNYTKFWPHKNRSSEGPKTKAVACG